MPALDLPPELRAVAAAWATMVGAVVGSFLNVVIARVPAGESVVRPRSRCPGCGVAIAWYDNVPVVSFLLLRARCRSCRRPISWRYPLVEALGAGAGYLAWARHGISFPGLAELILVGLLVALAFIDLDTWLLPYALTLPLLGAGLLAGALRLGAAPSLTSSALGAVVGGGAFWLVAFVGEKLLRKEALGLGDVWLLAGIGAWLGARALLPVVLLASVQGAAVGLVQLVLGKGQPGPPPAPGPAPEGSSDLSPDSPGLAPEPPPEPAPPPHAAAEQPASPPAALPPATKEGEVSAGEPGEREEVWIPPRHAVPFGPFLAAGALEWLFLARPLARAIVVLKPFL